MACGCATRAEKLLHRLGYRKQGPKDARVWQLETRAGPPIQIPAAELRRRHFRLTLFGVWKFLTLG